MDVRPVLIRDPETSTAQPSPANAASRPVFRALAWPLGAWFLLAIACYGLILPGRPAHRLSDFGSHTLYLSFIVLTAVMLLWRGLRDRTRRLLLWWPVAVGLGTFACVQLFKTILPLARPQPLTGLPKHDGFPSGHTTFAFAMAWLLTQTSPRLAPLWYALAVAIGWSRVEGSAHFPYQVLWGAVFGTLIGWLISRYLRPIQRSRP
jgi:membrane-associated phospholipid phosphatase